MIRKEWINILALVLFFALAFYYSTIVKTDDFGRVITSYDSDGFAATVSNKWLEVYFLPISALALYILTLIIASVSVYKVHVDRFFERFFSFKLTFIFLLFALYISAMLANQGRVDLQQYILIPLMAIAFFYLGHVFDHLKSDFFAPWIKGRNKLWEDSHHVGAWVFRICGFVVLLSFFFPELYMLFLSIPLFSVIIMIVMYSYIIFKKEHHLK